MEKNLLTKLSYVPGLQDIARTETEHKLNTGIIKNVRGSLYIPYPTDLNSITSLRSISRAHLVSQNPKYNPLYISNHKSILGDIVQKIINQNPSNSFKTFSISCAGDNSPEVTKIRDYIIEEFKLKHSTEADLKIHIAKTNDVWEIGAQTTPRPLSLRDYKERNMSGAMDPTVAWAMNHLCITDKSHSYLNIFSGSGTLLIEAAQCNQNLKNIVGFDINKKAVSLSIQNIKKARLLRNITVKEADIFDSPDFGMFDVITSDLPFGMAISKGADIKLLYKTFLEYAHKHLHPKGKLGVFTSEFEILEDLLPNSNFTVEQAVPIKLMTSEKEYLPTKILLLKRKV